MAPFSLSVVTKQLKGKTSVLNFQSFETQAKKLHLCPNSEPKPALQTASGELEKYFPSDSDKLK